MTAPLSAPAEADLVERVAEFVDDPLGFVMFAYPWKEKGPLEQYDGPDVWQRELLEDIGREVRSRGFDGLNAVLPIRQAISSGHGIGKRVLVQFLGAGGSRRVSCFEVSWFGLRSQGGFPQIHDRCHRLSASQLTRLKLSLLDLLG